MLQGGTVQHGPGTSLEALFLDIVEDRSQHDTGSMLCILSWVLHNVPHLRRRRVLGCWSRMCTLRPSPTCKGRLDPSAVRCRWMRRRQGRQERCGTAGRWPEQGSQGGDSWKTKSSERSRGEWGPATFTWPDPWGCPLPSRYGIRRPRKTMRVLLTEF